MKRKFTKPFHLIMLILSFIFLAFTLKLGYEVAYSPLDAAIKHPDRLTILYRPGCPRCHKALPRLLPRLLFSTKRDYLINADKLSDKQLKSVNLNITPGFMYHSKNVQTVNDKAIDRIWAESH